MARHSAARQETARVLTPAEEDAIGDAIGDDEQPPAVPDSAPPSAPGTSHAQQTQTLSSKQRQELRDEAERDSNMAEWERALAAWAIPGTKYTYDLMRTKPVSYQDPESGLTYLPGKDDGRGKFVQSYSGEEPPPLSEIENVHGGEEYIMIAKGPDPKDPSRTASKRVKFSILGAPKTVGTPQGSLPLIHARAYGLAPPADNSANVVAERVLSTLSTVMENNRKDMLALINAKTAAPTVDPVAEKRWQDERDERNRQHQERLAKEKADADERREAARIEREERREQAKLDREAAEAERKRQHEKEMKMMDQQIEARRSDEKTRREDEAQREKRHQEMVKEQRESMEKLVEKITKKEDDPEERILRTMKLIKELKDDEGGKQEDGPISRAIEKMIPEVSGIAKLFISKMDGAAAATEKKAKTAKQNPTVVAIDTPEAAASDNAKPVEQPKEELPPFEWYVEGDDPKAMARKFGNNIEKALAFKWSHKRIFQEMVLKFPDDFLGLLRALPIEQLLVAVKDNSPEDALIRTSAGELILKLIHKALVKQAAEAK